MEVSRAEALALRAENAIVVKRTHLIFRCRSSPSFQPLSPSNGTPLDRDGPPTGSDSTRAYRASRIGGTASLGNAEPRLRVWNRERAHTVVLDGGLYGWRYDGAVSGACQGEPVVVVEGNKVAVRPTSDSEEHKDPRALMAVMRPYPNCTAAAGAPPQAASAP